MPDDMKALAEGGLGAPVRRVEDFRLLRGRGHYTDDHRVADCAHMVLVRSPHAAARIRGIDASAARAIPGVLAVLTGDDLAALGPLETSVARQLPGGRPMPRPPYRILATDAARFVGDPVAAVIAETRAAAKDGAEAVVVDWDPLPAVTDAAAALMPGAPAVWPDHAPDSVSAASRPTRSSRVARSACGARVRGGGR